MYEKFEKLYEELETNIENLKKSLFEIYNNKKHRIIAEDLFNKFKNEFLYIVYFNDGFELMWKEVKNFEDLIRNLDKFDNEKDILTLAKYHDEIREKINKK